ncbi:hypothetical protein Q3G72_000449 [Acer saccharum]|nr:hypothetical protein Q3G72_000449 [Acer saccharum]
MESEYSRERSPGSLGCEESQVVINNGIPGRDVRERLFSVFVDNLNPRRFLASKQNGGKEIDVSKHNGGKLSYGDDWLSLFREDRGGNGTFNEVAKKEQMCDGDEIEKVWEMSWNSKDNEDIWLSKCAIGVLKEFGNVYSVNHRLSTKGLSFSSKYLGDKSILWIFDSEEERDGFVQSRFLWDDKFIFMGKGTDPSMTHSRLAWINCEGVPLRYWKPEFFSKLN